MVVSRPSEQEHKIKLCQLLDARHTFSGCRYPEPFRSRCNLTVAAACLRERKVALAPLTCGYGSGHACPRPGIRPMLTARSRDFREGRYVVGEPCRQRPQVLECRVYSVGRFRGVQPSVRSEGAAGDKVAVSQ